MRRFLRAIGWLAALLAGGVLWVAADVRAEDEAPRPKLAVLVVFDQLRGDYVKRWEHLFVDGGFKRLMKDGAWFTDCHYPYAYTLTAPGHASIATGATPARHGIIANDWYDRVHRETVSSVTPPPDEKANGLGPYRRRVESIGDVLQRATKGKAKVVSLSIKERTAILLAALRNSICCWFETKTGQFATSRYYGDPPPWVTAFNATLRSQQWLGKDWVKLRTDVDYARESGPDDFFAEGTGFEQGRAFPHPFVLKNPKGEPNYPLALINSPMAGDMLLDLAKRAIDAEKLGQRSTTDLLCVGFSSNDLIGHCWGPDSQEVLDVTLRSDRLMKNLFDYLDAKVGRGNYVIGLSADHGVCPLPELAKEQGKDAGRVPPEVLTVRAEAFLNEAYLPAGGKAAWLEPVKKANAWIYLNQATLKELNLAPAAVERKLADWLARQPGLQAAYTRTEVMGDGKLDDIGEMVRRSFRPEASGDVMAILASYHLFSPPVTAASTKNASFRTSHGTPHPYDTHVPLLVAGPRVRPGVRTERVTPQAMASILADLLGVPAPAGAEYPVPAGLLEK